MMVLLTSADGIANNIQNNYTHIPERLSLPEAKLFR